jgi:hypothetical protein
MIDVHVDVHGMVDGFGTWYGDGFGIHVSGSGYISVKTTMIVIGWMIG